MDDRYWVTIKSEQQGPYNLSQLQSMWRAGSTTDETLYWQGGFDEWIPISIMSDLIDPQPVPAVAAAQNVQHYSQKLAPKPPAKSSMRFAVFVLVTLIAGILLISAVITIFAGDSDRKVTDSGQTEGVIYRGTTRIIAKNLKSPSTAKFPSYYDEGAVTFTSLGNRRYSLSSYVDSQNGFGAMVRTHWTAIISVSGKTVQMEDLQTQ